MTELEQKLVEASQKYYTDGTSPYTDEEWDAMLQELRETQPDSPFLKTVGWGYNVWADQTPGAKVKHKYGTAGSLEKAYSWEEIKKDFRGEMVQLSLKLDGLSVVLYYNRGKLIQALTRGNGEIGIDITNKVSRIFPKEIEDFSFTGAVRGEILMTDQNFEEFKARHPEAKNSRNSAAGLINAKEISDDIKYLDIVVYTVVGIENESNIMTNIEDSTMWLKWNFPKVVPYLYLTMQEDMVPELRDIMDKLNLPFHYPVDGVVMKRMDVVEKNHEVLYTAQAFKFGAESAITSVKSIEWRLSKTRRLVPRINIKTVNVSGTNVSYCTAFNAQYIQKNNLGVDSVIKISKHGEIIPNVDEVIQSTAADIPDTCPNCGAKLQWDSVHLVCPNEDCGNAIIQDTLAWIKNIAPRDGFQDQLILKFLDMMVEQDFIRSAKIEDLMQGGLLQENDSLGVQAASWVALWNELMTKEITLYNALMALNLPGFGEKTCEKLACYPHIVTDLMDWRWKSIFERTLISSNLSELLGPARAQYLVENSETLSRLHLIRDRIIWEAEEHNTGEAVKVAITGKLSVKRADFEKELKSKGFLPGDISKETKYLITDDPNGNSGKNQKANQLGIEKVTEEEFRKRFLQ